MVPHLGPCTLAYPHISAVWLVQSMVASSKAAAAAAAVAAPPPEAGSALSRRKSQGSSWTWNCKGTCTVVEDDQLGGRTLGDGLGCSGLEAHVEGVPPRLHIHHLTAASRPTRALNYSFLYELIYYALIDKLICRYEMIRKRHDGIVSHSQETCLSYTEWMRIAGTSTMGKVCGGGHGARQWISHAECSQHILG